MTDADTSVPLWPLYLRLLPLQSGHTIVSYAHRPMAVAAVGDARLPVYMSTGLGGKSGVAAGRWYPFGGVTTTGQRTDDVGWFIKSGEQGDYYGSTAVRCICEYLDSCYPVVPAQFGWGLHHGTDAGPLVPALDVPDRSVGEAAQYETVSAAVGDQVAEHVQARFGNRGVATVAEMVDEANAVAQMLGRVGVDPTVSKASTNADISNYMVGLVSEMETACGVLQRAATGTPRDMQTAQLPDHDTVPDLFAASRLHLTQPPQPEVEVRYGLVDEAVTFTYRHGQCFALAAVVTQRLVEANMKALVVCIGDSEKPIHAYAAIDDEWWLDIDGPIRAKEAIARWEHTQPDMRLTHMTAGEMKQALATSTGLARHLGITSEWRTCEPDYAHAESVALPAALGIGKGVVHARMAINPDGGVVIGEVKMTAPTAPSETAESNNRPQVRSSSACTVPRRWRPVEPLAQTTAPSTPGTSHSRPSAR